MEKAEEKKLRERAAQTVCGNEYPGAVIGYWVQTGEEPTGTLHRSLLPVILRVHAELRKDAQKLAGLEVANESLRTGARLALEKLRLTG